MALQGFSIKDIDYTQISSVMDIADKKVNAYKSPIGIAMNLSLADNPNKVVAIQRLLSELDKRNLFGKVDFNFTDTKFSSEEIEKITKMMDGYKDKPINFSFDTNANNFSKQDIVNILKVVNGSKSTVYPFLSMANDGLSSELRQKFLENNPNIIQTPGNNPNLRQLNRLLGFSGSDIRSEIVNGANERRMSASEYANYFISSMDKSKLQELHRYSSALERLSMDYSIVTVGNLQKKGYDDENIFYKTIKQAMETKLQTLEQTNSNSNQTQTEPSYTLTNHEKKSTRYSEFKDFENHYNGACALYEKDGKKFLYLSSNETKQKCCIELDPNIELSQQLGTIACNIQAYNGYFITSQQQQSVSVNSQSFSLINYNELEFSNNLERNSKLSLEDVATKIDSASMDGYIANTLYQNKFNTTVTPEQFEILKYYKAEGYEFINSFLGSGDIKTRGNEKITPEFCNKLLLLDKAFEDNPPLEQDLVVYRGSKNRETDHSSFMSTSLSKSVATNFSNNNVYEIHVPKGSHVLSLDNIDGLRNKESEAEAEILLRPADFLYQSSQGNEHIVNINEHTFSQLLLDALERRKDEYLKGKSAEEVQQYMESIEFVKKQNANNNTNDKTTLQDRYDSLLANNTGTAEELWNMANQLELNDKSGEYTRYVPYAIVDRDPTFKPETMFGIIANNANEGYASEFKNDPSGEIGSYIADVKALGLLAEHNPDLSSSSRLLSTLNKISKETVACYQEGKSYDKEASTYFSMFALNIIPAYAKCEYNTPKQADLALQNIANITKNLEAYERNPHDVINTVHSIVNNSETDKDVATSAFRALNLVSPQNSEEASKMLSLYKTLSLDNPDLAEASISKMRKIYNDFPHDEKLQKECLSTLESLNGFRSKFDDETKQKLDTHSKSMKSKIDAETIKRAQGKETTWKAPTTSNSQRSSTNTQTYSNFGNTYGGR